MYHTLILRLRGVACTAWKVMFAIINHVVKTWLTVLFVHLILVGLPDEDGRVEIFQIHTAQMTKFKKMDSAVDLNELAKRTRNFTGAEIESVVRSAQATSMNRLIEVSNVHVYVALNWVSPLSPNPPPSPLKKKKVVGWPDELHRCSYFAYFRLKTACSSYIACSILLFLYGVISRLTFDLNLCEGKA